MSFPERRKRKENIKALLPAAKTSWTQMKSSSNLQDVFQRQEEAVKRNISSSVCLRHVFVSTCKCTITHICKCREGTHVTHQLQTWHQRRRSCHQSAAVGVWRRTASIHTDSAFQRRLWDTCDTSSFSEFNRCVHIVWTKYKWCWFNYWTRLKHESTASKMNWKAKVDVLFFFLFYFINETWQNNWTGQVLTSHSFNFTPLNTGDFFVCFIECWRFQ